MRILGFVIEGVECSDIDVIRDAVKAVLWDYGNTEMECYKAIAEAAEVNRYTVKRFVEGVTQSPHFKTVLGILHACEYTVYAAVTTKQVPRKRAAA